METPIVPTGFPDPALVITYSTALRFIRFRLNRFAHGQMKPWAVKHRFNYARLVEIKKDNRQRYVPLMQRLFTAFGYPVDVLRLVSGAGQCNHFFIFPSVEALALWTQELRSYDQLVMLATQ